MESLLAEQIMFCNKLLLTKNDRLPFYVVTEVARAIHPLNPVLQLWPCPGNLQLDELLSMPDYDFHRVALLIDELQDAIDAVLPDETDKNTIFRGGSLRMTVHFIRSGCGIPAIASWAQAFTAARGFSGYREGMTGIIVEPGSREHQSRIHKLLESRGPDSH